MNKIQINPDLDIDKYQKIYQSKGRVQIFNFFTDETVNYLLDLVVNNKNWYFAYNNGNNFYESDLSEVKALPPEIYQKFMGNIAQRANHQFQYAFNQYYISQAILLGEQKGHPLHQVHDFVNSHEYLQLMRKITSDNAIKEADSYATCYEAGHFLTDHDDNHATKNRAAAFVFNLTKSWNLNWGGYLAFYDDKENIVEALKPSFNTLNMFSVPQLHSVQQVTSFASEKRLSLLGWLFR